MRFKLEKEDVPQKDCNNTTSVKTPTQVRVNDKTTLSLSSISYIIIEEPTSQNFQILDLKYNVISVLRGLSQGLQLKLQRVGNDYKLALVTTSDEPYYYYYDGKDNIIATIGHIPQSYINGLYVTSYNRKRCSIDYELLENSKVLIHPKDIISSKNVSLILQDLQNLPDKRFVIETGDYFFKKSQSVYRYYKSAQVYATTGSKVGMLNNIVPAFVRISNTFLLFPFHGTLEDQDSYFAIRKLGNNYVGCISYENSTCKNFYNFNPDSFGYEHDNRPGPYPYYYNLENFDNFLEVDVNTKEYIDLEVKIDALKRKIERLERAGVQGPKGEPGERGMRGLPGMRGEFGPVGPPGSSGSQGQKGEQGHLGPKGNKGESGSQGKPGLKGDKGQEGGFYAVSGLTGKPGPKGNQGHPGLKGNPGEKGERGYSGSKGDKGVPGLSIIGEKGDHGEMGLRGFKGDVGPSGLKGQSGAKGDKGDSGSQGSKGERGWKGEPGSKGLQGLKGDSGMKGETGPQGVDGVPGIPGLKGDKGNIGPEGNKGELGVDGMPGVHGPKGEKGNVGPIGPQGLQGSKGHVGRSGSKGVDGVPGLIGIPGSKGDMGDKGEIGLPGTPGLQGEKGEQGVAGPKGERGNNGTDASPEEVAQKLISNGTIANEILEYREEGDLVLEQQIAGRLIYDKNIHEGIATELIDNRAQELVEALLNSVNDTLVEKFANSTELIHSISEELRKNPGKIKGSKGDIGAQGIPGIDGPKGSQGIQGPKGDMGNKGDMGLPGIQGPKGNMGNQGLQGQKGGPGSTAIKLRESDGLYCKIR